MSAAQKKPGDLTVSEYWDEYGLLVANKNGYICSAREVGHICREKDCFYDCEYGDFRKECCRTYKSYTRDLTILSKQLTCSIKDITIDAVTDALAKVMVSGGQRAQSFSEGTLNHILIALRTMLRYAYLERHIITDPVGMLPGYLDVTTRSSNRTGKKRTNRKPVTRREAREIIGGFREKHPERARSMTAWQNEKLLDFVMEELEVNGMAMGLAMMRYGGFRPAEVRALTWGDLVEIRNHPGTYYLVVKDSVDESGNKKNRVKRKDSARPVPVHMELALLLQRRKAFIEKTHPDIREYPICCSGNDFDKMCTEAEFSVYGSIIFDRIELQADDLTMYELYAAAEGLEDGGDDALYKTENLCLYVLRKAYCSDLQSKTQLTQDQIAYNMGHAMRHDGRDIRRPLSEGAIWDNACRQNSFVVSYNLHREAQKQLLRGNESVQFSNRGIVELCLDKKLLRQGGTVTIDVRAEEIGEDLVCYSDLLADTVYCKCTVEKLPEHPAQSRMPDGINMEWDTFEAQRDVATRDVRDVDDENEDMEDDLDELIAGIADKNEEGKNGGAGVIRGVQKKKGDRVTAEGGWSIDQLLDNDELAYDELTYDELVYGEDEEDEDNEEDEEDEEDAKG